MCCSYARQQTWIGWGGRGGSLNSCLLWQTKQNRKAEKNNLKLTIRAARWKNERHLTLTLRDRVKQVVFVAVVENQFVFWCIFFVYICIPGKRGAKRKQSDIVAERQCPGWGGGASCVKIWWVSNPDIPPCTMKWKVTLIVLARANECLKACVTVRVEESHRVCWVAGRKDNISRE